MADYKRQHTVNESYLKGFVDGTSGSRLCQYRKSDGAISWPSPNDATIAKYIYSFKNRDGSWNHGAEKNLCEIEGRAMPVVRKIERSEKLTNQERFDFSMFVAAMVRRPRYIMEQFDESLKKFSAGPGSIMTIFEQELPQLRKQFTEEAISEVKSKIERGDFVSDLDAGKAAYLRVWFENLPRHALGMANMHWQVWRAKKGHRFLTSDAPAFVRREGRPDDPGFVGIESLNVRAELTCPLSSKYLLMMKHKPCSERMDASKVRVRELNSLTIRMADSFVFDSALTDATQELVLQNNHFTPPSLEFVCPDGRPLS